MSNYVFWNIDKSKDVSLSNNNLTAITNSTTSYIHSNKPLLTGKWYWEIIFEGGSLYTQTGVTNELSVGGITNTERQVVHFNSMEIFPQRGVFLSDSILLNTVIGLALDVDNLKLDWYINGIYQLTTDIVFNTKNGIYAVFSANTSSEGQVTANFGATEFQYSMPIGYMPYDYDSAKANWLKITKHLIKSSNKIHTLLDNVLTYPNLSAPTQEQFEQFGMDALEGYENQISKVAHEMDEDGVLEDGRVLRKKINKNEWKINKMGVR